MIPRGIYKPTEREDFLPKSAIKSAIPSTVLISVSHFCMLAYKAS